MAASKHGVTGLFLPFNGQTCIIKDTQMTPGLALPPPSESQKVGLLTSTAWQDAEHIFDQNIPIFPLLASRPRSATLSEVKCLVCILQAERTMTSPLDHTLG